MGNPRSVTESSLGDGIFFFSTTTYGGAYVVVVMSEGCNPSSGLGVWGGRKSVCVCVCVFVCPGVIIILQIIYILFVLPWDLRAFSFWTSADFIEDSTVVHLYTVVHS